ncbi:hypothetical protein HMPREF1989_01107 [Porphyromonas gingivalis F0566]|nr:hypothetical protein HMPREF1989_01107 [Porphyromonas gingivalis F0566]
MMVMMVMMSVMMCLMFMFVLRATGVGVRLFCFHRFVSYTL